MAKAGRTSTIKYADKSSGQPELVEVFNEAKKVLSPFAKGNYIIKDDLPGNYSIYYGKPVETAGRAYPELPFAALLIQKGFVGFYFFPVYMDPSLKRKLPVDFARQLKGKSCFHLKKQNTELLRQLSETLKAGLELYRSKGWK
jgi:hypothetical protein